MQVVLKKCSRIDSCPAHPMGAFHKLLLHNSILECIRPDYPYINPFIQA